jgi:hypothetical protein
MADMSGTDSATRCDLVLTKFEAEVVRDAWQVRLHHRSSHLGAATLGSDLGAVREEFDKVRQIAEQIAAIGWTAIPGDGIPVTFDGPLLADLICDEIAQAAEQRCFTFNAWRSIAAKAHEVGLEVVPPKPIASAA